MTGAAASALLEVNGEGNSYINVGKKRKPVPHINTLFKTDYSCMEMYCFNEQTLEKILLGYEEAKQPSDFKSFKINMN